VAALAAAGLPIVVANPRRVRDFAKARPTRQDRCVGCRRLGAVRRASPSHASSAPGCDRVSVGGVDHPASAVAGPADRRAESAGARGGPIRRGLTDHIRWLERRVADVDRDLDQTITTSPAWRATDDLLQRVPSVGPVVSRTLLADVPELGHLNRKQIAAFIGVAPLARDSGTLRGKRTVWVAGRRCGRCCTWGPSWRPGATRSFARATGAS